MSEAAELSYQALARVAGFLRGLSTEQLADLAAGRVELTLSAAMVRASAATDAPLPRPVPEIAAALAGSADRAAATRYLDSLGLTAAQLRALAKALGIAV